MTKVIEQNPWENYTKVILQDTRVPDARGRFAMELASRLAIAAGTVEGEDSAGRARVRLQTPKEVAERACDIADAMFMVMESLGWMIDIAEPKLIPAPDLSLVRERRQMAKQAAQQTTE